MLCIIHVEYQRYKSNEEKGSVTDGTKPSNMEDWDRQ